MQHRGAPSSSASTALFSPRPRSAGAENRRTGEEFDEHGKGVFNPDRRGETGGFSVADHDAASSTSIRSDNDDFYSRCARIYASSLSTATPKSPRLSLTMEAWMASQSQSEVTLGLAHAMGNVSAALALQPHSGSRGWNPMGADTDQSTGYADEMGRPYRPVTPASSVVSCYPAPAGAAASSGQGGGWRPMAAHRNQEPAGRGWHWQDGRPKADLCAQWMTTGACRNGASCRLAHCKEEPLHQTQACEYVRAGLACPFGPRCPFPQ